MKSFCESLREHAINLISFKKKKMSRRNYMNMVKSVIFVKKKMKINILMMKNTVKLEIIVIIQENKQMLYIA